MTQERRVLGEWRARTPCLSSDRYCRARISYPISSTVNQPHRDKTALFSGFFVFSFCLILVFSFGLTVSWGQGSYRLGAWWMVKENQKVLSGLDQLMTMGKRSEMDPYEGILHEKETKKRSHCLAVLSTQGRHNSSCYWVSNTEDETGIKMAP